MKSIYKKIGEHIKLVDERNKGLRVKQLLGLSISKNFIPSVANIIGTDMENYKIIRKKQFACSTMQVRRDKKMPVALLQEIDEAIISQAYPVFEVKDENVLLPEYLMMWFTRSEFDREACFHAIGGVRGSLEWEDFENLQLPIPSIKKQREIVKEYNVIQNRIDLNQQLIQKIEETAQAIYKQWFVDFEFPDENGKPYKSNGGEMVWNEELQKEIPKGWKVGKFEDLELDVTDGNYSSKYPSYSEFTSSGVPFIRGTDFFGKCISPFNLLYISEEKHKELKKGHTKRGDILMGTRGEIGKCAFITNDFIDVNINAQLVRINGGKNFPTAYLGSMFSSFSFREELMSSTTGSALQQLPISNLMGMRIIIPESQVVLNSCRLLNPIHDYFIKLNEVIFKLISFKKLLLSKLATIEN
jgi:type I restriction enzyme S subunit